jgi:hypothetical protein
MRGAGTTVHDSCGSGAGEHDMGRIGKRLSDQNRNVVSVRVSLEELDVLQGIMETTKKSVSELMKEAFRSYLDQYRSQKDPHVANRVRSDYHDTLAG